MECNCGCGGQASGQARFLPGHDENVRAAVMYLLGPDTMRLCEIFGFGPGGRNAQQLCAEARRAHRR